MNVLKVVMVSKLFPVSHYTLFLGEGFKSLENKVEVTFYRSKPESIVVPVSNVKNVWSQSPLYPFQVFSELMRDRPHVVHVQHEFDMFGGQLSSIVFPLLLLLLKIGNIKRVVTVHQVVPIREIDDLFAETFAFPRKLYFLLKVALVFIYLSIAKLASGIIVHAEYNKHHMIGDYGAGSSKVHVVPIGVAQSKFNRVDGKWSLALNEKRTILFFGYLVKRKGVEFLIEAFSTIAKRYPDWYLVIAGGLLSYSRPYVDELLSIISKNQISERVIFLTTTPFPIDELHELYELSDFVVLPYVYSFSASLAFSFAMQHAKPVVATNIGVFKGEITNNTDGLLCTQRSSYSLEKAMEKLIESPGLRKTLSVNTQMKADSRSWCQVAEQTYHAYTDTLKP